ncbi:glutathione S-transferase C-terminal domain-containing protein homolog [Sitophilus oryzae]|uniref:Glutathione S-transferase C-terminal domain-containing protein homolog n=1 Tax=Sitophilus oryzae TaxID=7048 RepID=A0A6J2YL18_SITOR|nr:glutathione S-transferase C-terminal domain-containing protein homolog [Sitophilus oryzae]
MALLLIDVWCEEGEYFVDIKTFVILYILMLADRSQITLRVRIISNKSQDTLINVDLTDFCHDVSDVSEYSTFCKWPILLIDNYVISGLCSVARQICKLSVKDSVRNLLGFREACLVACAESSVWTKFCEIDIIQSIEDLISHKLNKDDYIMLPETIVKYENHLSQPVRIHNIYKIARNNINDQSLKSSTPRENLSVQHDYAEGPYMSLADVILYPCYTIFFQYLPEKCIPEIPLTRQWFDRLQSLDIPQTNIKNLQTACNVNKVVIPYVKNVSLYNADPNRTVAVKHTKQYKVENALDAAKHYEDIKNDTFPFGFEQIFDWDKIPIEVNPKGGSLPEKRSDRKCQQLENLVKAVLQLVGNKNYKIVDFCSGSGHLGLLVAHLFPKCTVVLVENKEKSLSRARETIKKLKLNNVVVVQSNLDYFIGSFNLGIALHACGVASDLVMQMCIKNKADFICCPCCYGGIKNCHEVSYPRSEEFHKIFSSNLDQYFHLAHAADQTHEVENLKTKQGYYCMDIVDTDRRLYAEKCGYEVFLGKLQPVTCTNKNNLLVGIYRKEK